MLFKKISVDDPAPGAERKEVGGVDPDLSDGRFLVSLLMESFLRRAGDEELSSTLLVLRDKADVDD